MAKWQNDLMLDAAFAWVAARITRINVCATQPTTYAEATSTNMLANTACTTTDFTIGNGDVDGRKVHISSFTTISVSVSGKADHIALTGSTGSTLLLITTCTSQNLVTGNTVSIPAWDDEIADAA